MKIKKIKVAVALSNNLFSTGICRLLDDNPSIEVAKVIDSGIELSSAAFKAMGDHIVLIDFPMLFNVFPSPEQVETWPCIILFDTNCGKENIITAIFRKKLSGVLKADADCDLLLKSIQLVSEGKVWVDNETVKELMNSFESKGGARAGSLMGRENEIVELAGKGYRNKDIATRLHISEATVKTHLYRIFKKLDVKTRYELVAFAVKNSAPGAAS